MDHSDLLGQNAVMAAIRFYCLSGCLEGESFDMQSPVVLGRDGSCDLVLGDFCASRRHAVIERTESCYRIRDLGSRNGVSVNGKQVTESTIRYGDRFAVGKTVFFFLSDVLHKTPAEEEGPTLHDVELLDVIEAERRLTADLTEEAATLEVIKDAESESASVSVQDSQRRREVVFLCQLSKDINGTLERESIIEAVVRSVFETITNAERISLFLFEASDPPAFREVRQLCRDGVENGPVSTTILHRIEEERVGILCGNVLEFGRTESICARKLRSFMCVPLVVRSRLLGAIYVESLSKSHAFSRADFELVTLIANHSAAVLSSAMLFEESQGSYMETVLSLGKALEVKDHYTLGHSKRVAQYAVGIGSKLGFDRQRLRHLWIAAELHDIGKIAVRDGLMAKDGNLTPEEFEQVKKHPELGVEILRPIRSLRPILPFIRHHHERYNGRGYPEGLQGEEIPLEARIINLADAFDAMTTQRPYNEPISSSEALKRCEREAGVSFDPACVRALVAHVNGDNDISTTMTMEVQTAECERADPELAPG